LPVGLGNSYIHVVFVFLFIYMFTLHLRNAHFPNIRDFAINFYDFTYFTFHSSSPFLTPLLPMNFTVRVELLRVHTAINVAMTTSGYNFMKQRQLISAFTQPYSMAMTTFAYNLNQVNDQSFLLWHFSCE